MWKFYTCGVLFWRRITIIDLEKKEEIKEEPKERREIYKKNKESNKQNLKKEERRDLGRTKRAMNRTWTHQCCKSGRRRHAWCFVAWCWVWFCR